MSAFRICDRVTTFVFGELRHLLCFGSNADSFLVGVKFAVPLRILEGKMAGSKQKRQIEGMKTHFSTVIQNKNE